MSRPKATVAKVKKNIALSLPVAARLELELFSEVDGRVPVGAQGELIEKLLIEHFAKIDKAAKKGKGNGHVAAGAGNGADIEGA